MTEKTPIKIKLKKVPKWLDNQRTNEWEAIIKALTALWQWESIETARQNLPSWKSETRN